MSGIDALNKKVSAKMFIETMAGRFKNILVGIMSDEEKMEKMIEAMAISVQEKRIFVRKINVQRNTNNETLANLKKQREKLIDLGGKNIDDSTRLGQIQQEIKMIDAETASQAETCKNISESYDIAYNNYREALKALETTKRNGMAMLNAIKAHKDALAMKDATRDQKEIDTSFLNDLANELNSAKAELRSDEELDADLDSGTAFSIDAELAKMDAAEVDDALMAEFKAAAASKK